MPHAEVEAYFADAPQGEIETAETIDKDHGRIETGKTSISRNVRWLLVNEGRRYPGHPRFPTLTSLVRIVTRTEHRGKIAEQRGHCARGLVLKRSLESPCRESARWPKPHA
ncbi:MAG TPA: hypothetical protein VKR62_06605 [Roseiarcus sp.]|nr:hypothetical protein [Roseiarcus sp.]